MRKMFVLAALFAAACNNASGSKLDEKVSATPVKNVARDNALKSFPDAKCDETGFEEPTLHSVRCTLKNGVVLYCTAGEFGTDCKPIFAPEEVQKAAAAEQQKLAEQQAAQAAAAAKKNPAQK